MSRKFLDLSSDEKNKALGKCIEEIKKHLSCPPINGDDWEIGYTEDSMKVMIDIRVHYTGSISDIKEKIRIRPSEIIPVEIDIYCRDGWTGWWFVFNKFEDTLNFSYRSPNNGAVLKPLSILPYSYVNGEFIFGDGQRTKGAL